MGHLKTKGGRSARAILGSCATAFLLICAFASPSLAAPTHPPAPSLDVTGLNHACGVAADKQGDLYASSAGESKVKVFDAADHTTPIAEISNANEPCALAVSTKGELLVSERATGNVVIYVPDAYPLTGSPTYGPVATVNASGDAKGIAIDPFDDRLYIAEGDRVGVYRSEVQKVTVQATAGTYKLKFEGSETAPIAFNATAAEVKAALVALPAIGVADVIVNGGTILFTGALAYIDVPQIEAISSLTGNEKQKVTVKATAGTYKLLFEGQETAPIAFNATAAELQAALEALAAIAPGDIAVSGGPGDAGGTSPYEVSFQGAYAGTDVDQISTDSAGLTGTVAATTTVQGPSIAVLTVTGGQKADVLEGELTEATGVAAYTNPSALAANQKLNLAVAENAGDELRIYTGPTSLSSLKLRKTITGVDDDEDPGTAEQEFSFGAAGAYLAADRGNENTATDSCIQVQVGGVDQACTQGHFFLHDAGNEALYEFDTTGEFFLQITSAALEDAEPTQVAVERSGGAGDGTVYVGAGAGAGAELLAFAPALKPSRTSLPEPLSKVLVGARAVATDCEGNVYVAAETKVRIYSPAGVEVTSFEVPTATLDLAVDCSGHVYRVNASGATEMTYYTPSSNPPTGSTTYTRHEPVLASSVSGVNGLVGVAVNPANDHVFVAGAFSFAPVIKEFGPPSGGSKAEGECGAGLGLENARFDIDVYGKNGHVYLSAGPEKIYILKCGKEAKDAELIREIEGGGGCPSGVMGGNPRIAVDQSNGHFIEWANNQPGNTAREYDALGACLAEFGSFASKVGGYRLAIDNSCALHDPPLTEATTPTCAATYPSDGNAYVAFVGASEEVQPFDLNAFGPLAYGQPPQVITGIADGFGPAGATLHGTVNPEEFELDECAFQYLTEEAYEENLQKIEEELIEDPFEGAFSQACEETPGEIGKGDTQVPVHADVTGIEPETTQYRYRLHASNPFGEDDGEALRLGPPILTTRSALPVGYDEATLRATIDPSGLLTTYRFQYLTEAQYQSNGESFPEGAPSTPEAEIPAGEDGEVEIEAPVTGLAQGTAYRYRILVENPVKAVVGPPQGFETLVRAAPQDCENSEYRVGLSALLPDCRAYELVSPAQTLGLPSTFSSTAGHRFFNSWFVAPRGPGAGESVAFYTGSIAGVDGQFSRAQRGPGAHPEGGWENEPYGFTFAQGAGDLEGEQGGVSADQRYMLHELLSHASPTELSFPIATYMRVPAGQASRDCAPEPKAAFELSDPEAKWELVGCGDLGTDLQADGRYISAAGTHVIFTSKAHLDDDAPPAEANTEAIYDREAGSASTEVLSLKPDDTPFGPGEAPRYIAATEDGEAVVFSAAGTLYLRRAGKTTAIAEGSTYAGISTDGKRVFFIDETFTPTSANPMIAAGLHACDVEGGNCAGPEQDQEPLEIAQNSVFVNVSADGSHVFFMSEEVLSGEEANERGEEAEDGESNLYAWDGTDIRFVAHLHPQDLVSFRVVNEDLLQWTNAIPGQRSSSGNFDEIGRASSPTRSTPDGGVLVFQSHAQLTDYDNGGKGEVYRYAPSAPGPQLSCASCAPSGAPHASPVASLLQTITGEATTPDTLIPNVTDDGSAVFFESRDALIPEDANETVDVYEWKAPGTEGPGGDVCNRPAGCLALISTGQSEEDSFLFGMSADGEDVFIFTREVLAAADVEASFSLYDARVLGGIPDPPLPAPCEGDACQGQGTPPPVLPVPATTGVSDGNAQPTRPNCRKPKRRVKGRCVKPKKHRKQKQQSRKSANKHKANHDRGASR